MTEQSGALNGAPGTKSGQPNRAKSTAKITVHRSGAQANDKIVTVRGALTWISQTYRCIGVENLRKILCCNSFSEVQESPDADRVYAEAV